VNQTRAAGGKNLTGGPQMERDAIKEAVKEALGEELKAFYIDRETHYQHHKFIADMVKLSEQCKNVVIKTLVGALVLGALGLMIVGMAFKQIGK